MSAQNFVKRNSFYGVRRVKKWRNTLTIVIMMICFGMGSYIILHGGSRVVEEWKSESQLQLFEHTVNHWIPSLGYVVSEERGDVRSRIEKRVAQWFPLGSYVVAKSPESMLIEDDATYRKLLALQEQDENVVDEGGNLVDSKVQGETSSQSSTPVQTNPVSLEQLRDFNYLLSHYYTVDSTTMVGADQLNADEFLKKDMHINEKTAGPKILIFHTHSQEAFVDSKPGDSNTSIVGMGAYLTELMNKKGIKTIHHKGVYDLINGKLDRSKAYQLAEVGVRKVLKENPSIEVVIDMHRDGVSESKHLVKVINGKPTAQIMFFNGLSRTKANGNIAYLKNPYIQDNLAFSFQMQLASESLYPEWARRIYLKGYRYSLHMMPKSLLIEAGAQTNTVEEMKNAMECLAEILYKVLKA